MKNDRDKIAAKRENQVVLQPIRLVYIAFSWSDPVARRTLAMETSSAHRQWVSVGSISIVLLVASKQISYFCPPECARV
jgi:hypothetical protein